MGLGAVAVDSGPGDGGFCGAVAHFEVEAATLALEDIGAEDLGRGWEWARKVARKLPKKEGLCVGIAAHRQACEVVVPTLREGLRLLRTAGRPEK